MVSFDPTMGQMTEIFQWPKCLSKKAGWRYPEWFASWP